ncbi:VRR-NUC domain-containing protein [Nereida ignava]|uniref:VRR-NUC domain-containing protein n=1 Tax=Nereida ignava TaxID=282199 RepID=UPI003C6EA3F9
MRLWRNNSGSLPDPRTGRYVTFGVGSPGGSDLIGYRKVTVTEEMVGQEIAQFAAVEVKTARGRVRPEQQRFIDHVLSAGGIAGIARSVDEARNILLT